MIGMMQILLAHLTTSFFLVLVATQVSLIVFSTCSWFYKPMQNINIFITSYNLNFNSIRYIHTCRRDIYKLWGLVCCILILVFDNNLQTADGPFCSQIQTHSWQKLVLIYLCRNSESSLTFSSRKQRGKVS
jgi:hypothetical protein